MSKCRPTHKLPNLPLLCRVWRGESDINGDPDIDDLKCQLVFLQTEVSTAQFVDLESPVFLHLFVAKGTDLRTWINWATNDRVEVPKLSGRFYTVEMVDDVAKGFPNEFRCAVLRQNPARGQWPAPMP
jgi:hypothetical protein